jgi:hypothetical protein
MLVHSRNKPGAIWINPAAYPLGIQAAWCFNETGNGGFGLSSKLVNFWDSVTHQAISYLFNGNPLQLFNVLNQGGRCVYNDSGSGFGLADTGQQTGAFDPKTWVIFGGTPTASNSTLISKSDNDSSHGWAIGINDTGGMSIAITNSANDVKWSTISSISPWVDTVRCFAFTWDGTFTASVQKILIDGIVQSHSFNQNGTGSHGTDAAQPLEVGISRNGPQYGGSNAISESFFFFNRPLTVPELQEMYIAPYRTYTSQLDRMLSSAASQFVNWFNTPLKVI